MNYSKNIMVKISLSCLLSAFLCVYNSFGTTVKKKTPEKVIIFDLDDTLITVDPKAYLSIAWKAFPKNISTLMFLKSSRSKDEYGNKRFKAAIGDEFSPGGAATSFAFYGLYVNHSHHFQKLIPDLLHTVWDYASFMTGANTLLNYLQQKGYPIVYATNKDYISYKHVAETLDKKYDNAFSQYPTFVLVTHPTAKTLSKWRETITAGAGMPDNFKKLIDEIINAQEDPVKKIHFADGFEKPQKEYYEKLKKLLISCNLAEHDHEYIFFDDKPINITKAKEHNIGGYTVRTIADIVEGLEKEEIVSPENDPELYAQLAKEGVFGFINQVSSYISKSPQYKKSINK